MTWAEIAALAISLAKLIKQAAEVIKQAAEGRDIEPELLAEIDRLTDAIKALPAIHAAQQERLRRAVERSS